SPGIRFEPLALKLISTSPLPSTAIEPLNVAAPALMGEPRIFPCATRTGLAGLLTLTSTQCTAAGLPALGATSNTAYKWPRTPTALSTRESLASSNVEVFGWLAV